MASPQASQSLADVARAVAHGPRRPRLDPRRRRISYFMLVRLVILASFTAIAAVLAWQREQDFDAQYHAFVWGTLVVGYALTIIFARQLPRTRDLDRFTWIQTTTDIVLTAVVVQMSGGTDSGFASLYLIAVLGAATMGGVRQTWAAAGACALIYGTTSLSQSLGLLEPLSLGQAVPPLPPVDAAAIVARTLAGLAGVTVLSSFLNNQLASSTRQVGELRAMNENILRSLSSGLIATDERRRVSYMNPAARAILGLADADLHRPVDALMPGLDAWLRASASEDPAPPPPHARTELEITTRAGRSVHLGLSCSPLLDGEGQPVGQLVNFQDVTRVHELAARVRRGERLAAVGGLAASVAHEIRNPLAAISGSAELLGAGIVDDDDARLLSIIRRESARLSALVTDMLAFTRPRAPQRRAVTLERVAREALENFRADPTNADVETELFAAPDAPPARVDPAQLSQVLWNLLRNAAEAMNGRGYVEVRVEARPAEGAVELSVSDDGPGIAPEQLDRVFDPFFTTKERGTGFGLAIVDRVVQDNGGSVALRSTLGEGSTFRLKFAAVEPDDEDALPSSPPRPPGSP